jgi:hypothetical protein
MDSINRPRGNRSPVPTNGQSICQGGNTVKLATFLVIKAIISLAFGISLALAPSPLASLYGWALNPVGTIMARLVGATLIGIGLVCWFARSAAHSELRESILLSFFVADTIGFIVTLLGQLSGVGNTLGWSNVVLWLLLALGLGYFRFLRPAAS